MGRPGAAPRIFAAVAELPRFASRGPRRDRQSATPGSDSARATRSAVPGCARQRRDAAAKARRGSVRRADSRGSWTGSLGTCRSHHAPLDAARSSFRPSARVHWALSAVTTTRRLAALIERITDPPTFAAVTAERAGLGPAPRRLPCAGRRRRRRFDGDTTHAWKRSCSVATASKGSRAACRTDLPNRAQWEQQSPRTCCDKGRAADRRCRSI